MLCQDAIRHETKQMLYQLHIHLIVSNTTPTQRANMRLETLKIQWNTLKYGMEELLNPCQSEDEVRVTGKEGMYVKKTIPSRNLMVFGRS